MISSTAMLTSAAVQAAHFLGGAPPVPGMMLRMSVYYSVPLWVPVGGFAAVAVAHVASVLAGARGGPLRTACVFVFSCFWIYVAALAWCSAIPAPAPLYTAVSVAMGWAFLLRVSCKKAAPALAGGAGR
jgi:hypothetical protein